MIPSRMITTSDNQNPFFRVSSSFVSTKYSARHSRRWPNRHYRELKPHATEQITQTITRLLVYKPGPWLPSHTRCCLSIHKTSQHGECWIFYPAQGLRQITCQCTLCWPGPFPPYLCPLLTIVSLSSAA
jgi:hypothetical protein